MPFQETGMAFGFGCQPCSFENAAEVVFIDRHFP